jgi:hypothetical protein
MGVAGGISETGVKPSNFVGDCPHSLNFARICARVLFPTKTGAESF